jgi:hypothetical protein
MCTHYECVACIYMYIYIYIYVCTCVHIMNVYLWIYTHAHTHKFKRTNHECSGAKKQSSATATDWLVSARQTRTTYMYMHTYVYIHTYSNEPIMSVQVQKAKLSSPSAGLSQTDSHYLHVHTYIFIWKNHMSVQMHKTSIATRSQTDRLVPPTCTCIHIHMNKSCLCRCKKQSSAAHRQVSARQTRASYSGRMWFSRWWWGHMPCCQGMYVCVFVCVTVLVCVRACVSVCDLADDDEDTGLAVKVCMYVCVCV